MRENAFQFRFRILYCPCKGGDAHRGIWPTTWPTIGNFRLGAGMKSLCDLLENMDTRGSKSDRKHPVDSPTEATDQKVRGSNSLRRAKKYQIFFENLVLLSLLHDFECGSNRPTHILTHTGKCLERECSTSKKPLWDKHFTVRNDIIGARKMAKAIEKACT